jgi:hypothetical protein
MYEIALSRDELIGPDGTVSSHEICQKRFTIFLTHIMTGHRVWNALYYAPVCPGREHLVGKHERLQTGIAKYRLEFLYILNHHCIHPDIIVYLEDAGTGKPFVRLIFTFVVYLKRDENWDARVRFEWPRLFAIDAHNSIVWMRWNVQIVSDWNSPQTFRECLLPLNLIEREQRIADRVEPVDHSEFVQLAVPVRRFQTVDDGHFERDEVIERQFVSRTHVRPFVGNPPQQAMPKCLEIERPVAKEVRNDGPAVEATALQKLRNDLHGIVQRKLREAADQKLRGNRMAQKFRRYEFEDSGGRGVRTKREILNLYSKRERNRILRKRKPKRKLLKSLLREPKSLI